MTALTAFEVQSFRNGNWKIETITDSKEMAVHQAEQVIMNPAVNKVRVVEEAYDEASAEQKFRIVFLRDKKVAARPAAAANAPKTEANPDAVKPEAKAAVAANAARSRSASVVALSLKFGVIVCAGIAVIIALRYLGTNF